MQENAAGAVSHPVCDTRGTEPQPAAREVSPCRATSPLVAWSHSHLTNMIAFAHTSITQQHFFIKKNWHTFKAKFGFGLTPGANEATDKNAEGTYDVIYVT